MDRVDDTLAARAKTHGDFTAVSGLTQALLDVVRHSHNWNDLTPAMKSALEHDAVKTARILCGDAFHADHWLDKAGYAQLVARELPQ